MPESSFVMAGFHTIAALLCLLAGARERGIPEYRRYAPLLFFLGLVLWALALQQVTGSFSAITDAARQQSRVEGWYQDRRDLQVAAIRAILPAGAVAAAGLLWWVRAAWKRYLPVLLTLTFVICFAAVQAVSHHDIDALLGAERLGFSLRTWGNLAGVALTVVSLLPFLKRNAPRPRAF